MSRLTVIILVFAVFLSGCSAMSKKECINADWYSLGLQDGRAGYPQNRMSNYVATCQKHDVAISQSDYQAGHNDGIREFCQPSVGYDLGLKGRALPQVCPSDLQVAFALAHEEGYTQFKLKRDINTAQSQIQNAEKKMSGADEAIVAAKAAVFAAVTTEEKNSAQAALDAANDQRRQVIANQIAGVGALACASGDWYRAGLTDGEAGRSGSTFKRHLRRCEDYHPATNQSNYIKGQSAGVQQYCTFDTGYALGQNGRTLSTLCQGQSNRNLQAGYARGLEEYDEKITIAGLKQKKSALDESIPKLAQEQTRLENEFKRDDLTSAQKLEISRKLNRVQLDKAQQESVLYETNNELNCYIADWQALGFESGEAGDVYENGSLNCRRFGIEVDTGLFESGYQLGLERYCTKANGQRVGAIGQTYQDVCPSRLEPQFLDGYLPAFRAFQRAALKKQLTVDIRQSDQVLQNVRTELDVLTQDLERTDLTRSERLAIINEAAALSLKEESLTAENEKLKAHQQCLTDDWFALGQQHGTQGLSSQLRALNCPRFEERPQNSEYRNGLARGLTTWCTQKRGYDTAMAGEAPSTACSKTTHRTYFQGYANGQDELERVEAVKILKLEKLELLEALPGIDARLVEIDAALANTALSNTSRRRLTQEKLSLQSTRLTYEDRLETIEVELAALGG